MNILLISLSFLAVACSGIQPRYHEVGSGDSLVSIAKRYAVPLKDLKARNRSQVRRGLQAGMRLYIPFEARPDWNKEFEVKSDGGRREVASAEMGRFIWPVRGAISSPYGPRYLRRYGRGHHDGIDIVARQGTPVRSARSGHVIYANNRISGYGNMIIVRHPGQFATVYAHLSRFHVRRGQYVAKGQLIGRVGRTGRATSPHLHFEVRDGQSAVDPLPFLTGPYASRVSQR